MFSTALSHAHAPRFGGCTDARLNNDSIAEAVGKTRETVNFVNFTPAGHSRADRRAGVTLV
jgi:hypothetical protein